MRALGLRPSHLSGPKCRQNDSPPIKSSSLLNWDPLLSHETQTLPRFSGSNALASSPSSLMPDLEHFRSYLEMWSLLGQSGAHWQMLRPCVLSWYKGRCVSVAAKHWLMILDGAGSPMSFVVPRSCPLGGLYSLQVAPTL